ncbi:MAG: alkaline phosphatase family protein [Candidatus Woesearchaeota archaeon]
MYPFTVPDYRGKSIVNLMSSVAKSFGATHSYKESAFLSSTEISKYRNVILLVVDGLGYNYLIKQKDSFLNTHCKGRMTSTFLPTTACANTTFIFGYPPQQHGLTGWYVNLKEVGSIVSPLPFVPRHGGCYLGDQGFTMDKIMSVPPFHIDFNAQCYFILDKYISTGAFTDYASQGMSVVPSASYKNMFTQIRRIMAQKSRKRVFIHAYMYEHDSLAHQTGSKSEEVRLLFQDIDKRIKSLARTLKDTNTLLIVTADHGFMDTVPERRLFVDDIPGLYECLTIPMAGEGRTRDCFIRPHKVDDFKRIYKKYLQKYCWCFEGTELIKNGLYGLGKPSSKLLDRVGDFVLVMKDNYTLRNRLANHDPQKKFKYGVHGGVSDDEMYVPLVVIKP